MKLPSYPVTEALPALQAALAEAGTAVLTAPPGSGKTTIVPLALMDAPWLEGKRIVVLEPRRVAARLAARRMASLRGESVGQSVGYQVRFEKKLSRASRIQVLTEGLLTRRLLTDPELDGTGLLIFDEFHERSLDADLALALALEAREVLNPSLRILVMSATLDSERIARLLDGAPVIRADGKLFPVSVRYGSSVRVADVADAVSEKALQALDEADGDILAFLPGAREIGQAQRLLESRQQSVAVRPLYGQLPTHAQDLALMPDDRGRRKIILATNIAQTSLTVEGVHQVIDGGFSRAPVFDASAGANRLETRRLSRAAAEQRAGRAGRLGPGIAWRLWSQDQQGALAAHDTPEILCADLSGLALQLAAFGHRDPSGLRLLDEPPKAHWSWAIELLQRLGAIDSQGQLSEHGRTLATLPLAPRLGQLMCIAEVSGLAETGAWLASSLEVQSQAGNTDLFRHLSELRRQPGPGLRASVQQLLRATSARSDKQAPGEDQMAALVARAFPERLGRRREGLRERSGAGASGARELAYQCVDGGEARISERDPLARSEWLAIAHWEPGAQRRVRLACAIDPDSVNECFSAQLRTDTEVRWDDREAAVVARRMTRLGALVLSEQAIEADADALLQAMLEGIRRIGLAALPWTETCRQWQARVMSLCLWQPDSGWPDVSDATLSAQVEDWLAPFLSGVRRRAHLDRVDLPNALHALLDYPRQQALARLAPTHCEVPSGRRLALHYSADGSAPQLEVKLQEMFGCVQSPAICEGAVKLRLQLLSPAGRPVAVTDDIGRFWHSAYADVRKEMRGRYPKHPWPEDPLDARPTHRAKPRKS